MADAFDVVVIGSGPGGYVTAIRASQLGFKTAIVERAELGGICLNWGCIPTKALLKSGEVYEQLDHLKDYGLSVEKRGFDFEAVVQRSRKVAAQMNSGVTFLMKKHKIEVVQGTARLEKGSPAPTVVVGQRKLTAKHVILATGARARTVPAVGLEPDGERVWTYREALVPKAAPKSLVVVGSGAIGMEFASFYRALGSEVTVIEMMPRILPVEDEEISKTARKAFEKRGIRFRVPANVKKLTKGKGGVSLEIEADGKAETLQADVCIVAIGIVGNVEDLGLEALGVKIEKTHVVTDKHGATGVPGLYAIGDVAGPPWLAHKASHEGVHCIEHIAGLKPTNLTAPIPGCTYTTPQIASVGLTEAQAKEQGLEPKVGRFPFRVNGKAVAAGEPDGLVKTIFDGKTGALIGAHMVGHEVTEMIQGFAMAMTLEATEAEIQATVFPHPTMSEAMHEAALDAYGRVLHI
ncbi:pyruvate dehydrogenase complex, E3 component, lipoamide dehydrogenase [Phenylobacterium zucineum HLK1]|uniref:Dihydrolipoyl dehydrogenase n=1 Tax=Phenylobacterium zucineum (strain HLK1) TaxID=450851 RepID=B4RBV3_PHEZH|nr:dihydrolipoyl dehydrogenase [Phenylobacterium zucineum]ACG78150.1 pyruvate dehydrogenase complex, E3 component, lipoamide dehydrogenase [Phenylobacterium zucineum HLK1]